ncbi:hypothetical protein [Streptomyces sp. NPDC005096]|uniref:hypothetical protein n=1 Tax=Streptomyces sp. NPDC005096 TaxID=3154559 RepID=UPI0033A0D1E4
MTEVELVATAFATGAAAGLTGSARGAVHDLYAGLREAVRRRLVGGGGNSGGGYGVRVLDAYETDPDVWRTRLLQVLTGSGVETDEEILAAARAMLRAERPTGHIIVDTTAPRGCWSGTAPRSTTGSADEAVDDSENTEMFEAERTQRSRAEAFRRWLPRQPRPGLPSPGDVGCEPTELLQLLWKDHGSRV